MRKGWSNACGANENNTHRYCRILTLSRWESIEGGENKRRGRLTREQGTEGRGRKGIGRGTNMVDV
jgi:hypothetical protein